MPVPKKRRSKSKKRIKKAYFKIEAPNLQACPECGSLIVPHRACPDCGKYKGRQVIALKIKEKEKETEKQKKG